MNKEIPDKEELVINGLSKRYPNGVQALDNVHLTIPNGIFGLLGENGAGKTTLMNILATLVQADKGTVRLGSLDCLAHPEEMRRHVGYLPQEFGVYPGVSAVEMLDHFAVLKGIADAGQRRQHIGELLELVNLDDVKQQTVDTYSGGMRRRFGVAQSLIAYPGLIIVDEPTAGLDPVERARFQQALSNISENTIVILSTHIIEDINNTCPNSAILDGGRLVVSGTTGSLVASLKGRIWDSVQSSNEEIECGDDALKLPKRLIQGEVMNTVISEAKPGEKFQNREPNLEDVFFAAKAGYQF